MPADPNRNMTPQPPRESLGQPRLARSPRQTGQLADDIRIGILGRLREIKDRRSAAETARNLATTG